MQYEDFTEAFISELALLLSEGHPAEAIVDPASPASNFGQSPRESIERFGASFSVDNLAAPILSSPGNPFNLEYGVGLLMWTFAGSTDSQWLQYYGGRLGSGREASLGKRLFRNDGLDQVDLAVRLLEGDPGSRRAFMPVFDMRDLLVPGLEIPCAAGFQVFARSGELHGVTVMRAQNALEFLPLDLFVFSCLLQYMADAMNLSPGSYSHMSTSFHVFKDDSVRAKNIVSGADEVLAFSLGDSSGFSRELNELLVLEEHLRRSAIRGDAREVRALARERKSSRRFGCDICRNIATVLLATAARRVGGARELSYLGLSAELSEQAWWNLRSE